MRLSGICFSFFTLFQILSSTDAFAQTRKMPPAKTSGISPAAREIIDNNLLTGTLENLSALNEHRLSESILKEHLKFKKNDPHALLLLSSIYSTWGKYPESQQALNDAIKYQTESTDKAFLKYQTAVLRASENKPIECLDLLRELTNDSSLKVTAKAQRAIAELNSNPQAPLPPWLERKHLTKRQLNELSMQKSQQAKAEEVQGSEVNLASSATSSAQVALNRQSSLASFSSPNRWWPLSFSGSTAFNVGGTYDTNILQIPDKLAPLVSDKSGLVYTGSVQALAGSAFGPGNLSISAALSSSINANQNASNLNSFNGSNSLQWSSEESARGMSWGLTNALSGSFMNTNGYKLYNWSKSTGALIAKRIGDASGIDVNVNGGLSKFPGVEINNTNDDRNGTTLGAGLNVNTSASEFAISTGVSWAKQNAKGKNFRTSGTTGLLNVSRPVKIFGSQIALNTSATRSSFPEAERQRTDTLVSAGLTWGIPIKPVSEQTKLSLGGALQSSSSSLPDAAFKKYTFSAVVDHAF